jgi:repressor LexA
MLNEQQTQVLRYIRRYAAENECTPTPRDIAEHLGLRRPGTVAVHLNALHRKGCIRWTPGVPHSIKLPAGVSDIRQLLSDLLSDITQPKNARQSEPAMTLVATAPDLY